MEYIGQILVKVLKAHRKTMAKGFSKLNLYPGQEGLLYYLSLTDGQTMTELREKLEIKLPTLFIMIDRMEKSGWITKAKDEKNKRVSRVFLTNQGREQLSKLSKVWLEIEAQLGNDFDEEEKVQLKVLLHKLLKNLQAE
ncbi:MAG TPA: MarR family transcriptional regulator [Bacteroidales bacterium]|nr:MarR family transcriptional regulator [Bacteroidales bacterium]